MTMETRGEKRKGRSNDENKQLDEQEEKTRTRTIMRSARMTWNRMKSTAIVNFEVVTGRTRQGLLPRVSVAFRTKPSYISYLINTQTMIN